MIDRIDNVRTSARELRLSSAECPRVEPSVAQMAGKPIPMTLEKAAEWPGGPGPLYRECHGMEPEQRMER